MYAENSVIFILFLGIGLKQQTSSIPYLVLFSRGLGDLGGGELFVRPRAVPRLDRQLGWVFSLLLDRDRLKGTRKSKKAF